MHAATNKKQIDTTWEGLESRRIRKKLRSFWKLSCRRINASIFKSTNRTFSEGGFTFIEIMVVVAILAILAALVVPRIAGRTDDARRTAAKVQIRHIEGALQLYKMDNSIFPSTEQGLIALVEKPTVGTVPKKWKAGGYLPNVPNDPWGTPYKYLSPSPRGDFEVISLAGDVESGGEGKNADITNWELDKE